MGRNGWYRANCPVCISRRGSPDKRLSWGYSAETGWWHCFRCGASGSLTAVVPHSKVIRKREAVITEVPLPPEFRMLEIADSSDDPFARLDAATGPTDFLAMRGIPLGLARTIGTGACFSGRYRNRVIFPVRSHGRTLGFVARSFRRGKTQIPYLYPEGMSRGSVLFNQDALGERTSIPVLVVEGVLDALPYWPDAVACLGKPSEEQVRMLLRARRPVVMCLDGDAWRLGFRVASRLQFDGAFASAVKLPPRTDPNDQALKLGPMWLIDHATEAVARLKQQIGKAA